MATLLPRTFSLASSTRRSHTLPSFLVPCLQHQHRHLLRRPVVLPQCRRPASILSSISDNKGAYNKKIVRGRGASSGKGKTSGRGHKGQKARGKVPAGFNGGQTPDWVVKGPRGFKNP